MAITISAVRNEEVLGSFSTSTSDDFYFFRDSINAILEKGEFGSRFPTLLNCNEPSSWPAKDVATLRREVATIAEEFKKLPPKPADDNWASRLEMRKENNERMPANLYEVFTDSEDKPILGELLRLCDLALSQGLSMSME